MRIAGIVEDWSPEDRANLWHILSQKAEKRPATPSELEEGFVRLYNNALRTGSRVVAKTTINKVDKLFGGRERDTSFSAVRTTPSYEELFEKACRHSGVKEADASLAEQELFLSQEIILSVLKSMSPRKRAELLQATFDPSQVANEGGVRSTGMAGPITVLGTIGIGQASGFGIYLAVTTALGFLTSALGITLPFAIYTGLTTALSMFLGPLGIAAAILWAAYKMTGPNWKWLIPALLYVAAVRHRPS